MHSRRQRQRHHRALRHEGGLRIRGRVRRGLGTPAEGHHHVPLEGGRVPRPGAKVEGLLGDQRDHPRRGGHRPRRADGRGVARRRRDLRLHQDRHREGGSRGFRAAGRRSLRVALHPCHRRGAVRAARARRGPLDGRRPEPRHVEASHRHPCDVHVGVHQQHAPHRNAPALRRWLGEPPRPRPLRLRHARLLRHHRRRLLLHDRLLAELRRCGHRQHEDRHEHLLPRAARVLQLRGLRALCLAPRPLPRPRLGAAPEEGEGGEVGGGAVLPEVGHQGRLGARGQHVAQPRPPSPPERAVGQGHPPPQRPPPPRERRLRRRRPRRRHGAGAPWRGRGRHHLRRQGRGPAAPRARPDARGRRRGGRAPPRLPPPRALPLRVPLGARHGRREDGAARGGRGHGRLPRRPPHLLQRRAHRLPRRVVGGGAPEGRRGHRALPPRRGRRARLRGQVRGRLRHGAPRAEVHAAPHRAQGRPPPRVPLCGHRARRCQHQRGHLHPTVEARVHLAQVRTPRHNVRHGRGAHHHLRRPHLPGGDGRDQRQGLPRHRRLCRLGHSHGEDGGGPHRRREPRLPRGDGRPRHDRGLRRHPHRRWLGDAGGLRHGGLCADDAHRDEHLRDPGLGPPHPRRHRHLRGELGLRDALRHAEQPHGHDAAGPWRGELRLRRLRALRRAVADRAHLRDARGRADPLWHPRPRGYRGGGLSAGP
mmetsp:Transcript_116966/g.327301  ORF Transcript_116966/g.327301 Transcript_116966/m.327301 type:complete len:704 (-) Transcript_116966:23-2134(-)